MSPQTGGDGGGDDQPLNCTVNRHTPLTPHIDKGDELIDWT